MKNKPLLLAIVLTLAACHPFEDSDDYPLPDSLDGVPDFPFFDSQPDQFEPDLQLDLNDLDAPEDQGHLGDATTDGGTSDGYVGPDSSTDSVSDAFEPDPEVNKTPILWPAKGNELVFLVREDERIEATLTFRGYDPDSSVLEYVDYQFINEDTGEVISDGSPSHIQNIEYLPAPGDEEEDGITYYAFQLQFSVTQNDALAGVEDIQVIFTVADGEDEQASAEQSLHIRELGDFAYVDCSLDGPTEDGVVFSSVQEAVDHLQASGNDSARLKEVRIASSTACLEDLTITGSTGLAITGNFANIDEQNASPTPSRLEGKLTITEGPQVYFDQMSITGSVLIKHALALFKSTEVDAESDSLTVYEALVYLDGLHVYGTGEHGILVKSSTEPNEESNWLDDTEIPWASTAEEPKIAGMTFDTLFAGRGLVLNGLYWDSALEIEGGLVSLHRSIIDFKTQIPTDLTQRKRGLVVGSNGSLRLSEVQFIMDSGAPLAAGIVSRGPIFHALSSTFVVNGGETQEVVVHNAVDMEIVGCSFGIALDPYDYSTVALKREALVLENTGDISSEPMSCESMIDPEGLKSPRSCCHDKGARIIHNRFFSFNELESLMARANQSQICMDGNLWLTASPLILEPPPEQVDSIEELLDIPGQVLGTKSLGLVANNSDLILHNNIFYISSTAPTIKPIHLQANLASAEDIEAHTAHIFNNSFFLFSTLTLPQLLANEVNTFIVNNHFNTLAPSN